MYKRVDLEEEIIFLSHCKIIAFNGVYKNKYINVTFEKQGGDQVTERYYFPSSREYIRFNHKIRELYYAGE